MVNKKTLVIWCLSQFARIINNTKLTFGDNYVDGQVNTPLSSLQVAEMVENDSLEEHRNNIIYL